MTDQSAGCPRGRIRRLSQVTLAEVSHECALIATFFSVIGLHWKIVRAHFRNKRPPGSTTSAVTVVGIPRSLSRPFPLLIAMVTNRRFALLMRQQQTDARVIFRESIGRANMLPLFSSNGKLETDNGAPMGAYQFLQTIEDWLYNLPGTVPSFSDVLTCVWRNRTSSIYIYIYI